LYLSRVRNGSGEAARPSAQIDDGLRSVVKGVGEGAPDDLIPLVAAPIGEGFYGIPLEVGRGERSTEFPGLVEGAVQVLTDGFFGGFFGLVPVLELGGWVLVGSLLDRIHKKHVVVGKVSQVLDEAELALKRNVVQMLGRHYLEHVQSVRLRHAPAEVDVFPPFLDIIGRRLTKGSRGSTCESRQHASARDSVSFLFHRALVVPATIHRL
jgi:hypothetical protein